MPSPRWPIRISPPGLQAPAMLVSTSQRVCGGPPAASDLHQFASRGVGDEAAIGRPEWRGGAEGAFEVARFRAIQFAHVEAARGRKGSAPSIGGQTHLTDGRRARRVDHKTHARRIPGMPDANDSGARHGQGGGDPAPGDSQGRARRARCEEGGGGEKFERRFEISSGLPALFGIFCETAFQHPPGVRRNCGLLCRQR